MSQPAPGWYPDPAGTLRLRWWNGGSWTEQYQPMPAQQQGFPQQGMGQQAPTQTMPAGTPNPGGALAQASAMQHNAAPSGPRLPSNKQAPTVSSSPYGSKISFDQPKMDSQNRRNAQPSAPNSRWRIGMVVASVTVLVFGVTTVVAGASFASARRERAAAEDERRAAQSQLDQATSELEQAKKDLEEASR